MTDREDLLGLEFDFLAVDRLGCVAVLSSAGSGPIPLEVLGRVSAEEARLAAFEEEPTTTAPLVTAAASGDTTTWERWAARGLYVFDFDLHQGPYVAMATPAEPRVVAVDHGLLELPVTFAAITHIDLRALGIDVVA